MNALDSFLNIYDGKTIINIIGRSDTSGSYEYNDTLSRKRAKMVEAYLITNGFPPEKIAEVKGIGKRNPVELGSPKMDALNRVVWIRSTWEEPIVAEKNIATYSLQDSLVFLFPPYNLDYLNLSSSPTKGDTLQVDTLLSQVEDTLFITRILYIAEAIVPEKKRATPGFYTLPDAIIWVFPPFEREYLSSHPAPQKGDILRVDSSFFFRGDSLFLARKVYQVGATSTTVEYLVREISRKTKKKALSQVFLDSLEKSQLGEAIIIRDIDFEFGYHVIPRSNLPALQAVSTALEQDPKLRLEIRGHVCCGELGEDVFDKQSNQYDLSLNRAKEIYNYFIQNGVDKNRLSYSGYGMKLPLVYPEIDKDDQYKNRRIEFIVLGK